MVGRVAAVATWGENWKGCCGTGAEWGPERERGEKGSGEEKGGDRERCKLADMDICYDEEEHLYQSFYICPAFRH